MTKRGQYLLSEIRRIFEHIREYCEKRIIFSDGERERWRYVSSVARDGIREAKEMAKEDRKHEQN